MAGTIVQAVAAAATVVAAFAARRAAEEARSISKQALVEQDLDRLEGLARAIADLHALAELMASGVQPQPHGGDLTAKQVFVKAELALTHLQIPSASKLVTAEASWSTIRTDAENAYTEIRKARADRLREIGIEGE